MNKAPRFEEIQRAEVSRAIRDFFAVRLLVLPLGLVVVCVVLFFDPSLMRRTLVASMYVAISILFVVQYARHKRGSDLSGLLWMNGLVLTIAQTKLVIATGGVDSPLFPAMVIMAFVVSIFLTPRWVRVCLGIQIAATLALTIVQASGRVQLLPSFFGVSEAPSPSPLLWTRGLFGVLFLLGAMRVASRTRRTFDAVGESAIRARDESLESYAQETRALTTMAGEIAHELKNPLATVKALAHLVAKDADGKSAERLNVLRREVDRMQTILEEFLNFSRPLVPLTQAEVRLDALCADVALLHESVALERKVNVISPQEIELTAFCDARKVKQILINLVQNAIAASPAGGEIRIAVTSTSFEGEPAVMVAVVDQGGGLPEAIAPHVFDAGVTTKAGGSGLGLTVSRALARQHGGDLALRSTPSGCIGELVLPRRRPEPERAGQAA